MQKKTPNYCRGISKLWKGRRKNFSRI